MDDKIIKAEIVDEYNKLVKNDRLLPIKISDFYMRKVVEEVKAIGINGPLYKSVLPTKERMKTKSSIETRDYVEEYKHMPVEGADYIIQKYNERIIFIITDICFSHCQYCFRTYNLTGFQNSNLKSTIENKIKVLKEYLSNHEEITEVILSGGDPLSVGYDNLEYIFKELKEYNIRLHTRAIVYNPYIFTDEIIKLLKDYKIRLVFHINHPYEICEIVNKKIKELDENGIKMYSQFPLLRGINDSAKVLDILLRKMDDLHIRPISIFIPDPLAYSASFRIDFERIEKIQNELNWTTPSWVNSVRFTLDTTIGKVRRENIIRRNDRCITFEREGNRVDYYDLDDGLDEPSDLSILLWKNNN